MKEENRETIDQLRAENKMLRHWLSLISHDFRGLFANMSMLLGLYESDTVPQETLLKMLPEIKQLSDRNNKTVESTIEWIKTQMQGFAPHADNVSLFGLYEKLYEEFDKSLKTKEISFIFEGNRETHIITDGFLLMFILKHLVDNAIKYSYPSGTMQFVVKENETDYRIAIVDDGVGIDEDILENIFLFNSGTQTGTLGEKGAGLSLIIVNEFVNLLDMKIEINSLKEEGCKVELSIPKLSSIDLVDGE